MANNKIPNYRVKTPPILQMESTECAAAALAIILGYYKKCVSLAELREACDVSRDGSRADNMLLASGRYGLNYSAFQTDEWQTVFERRMPCVVFWQFNHFIVIEGYRNKIIYANDPAIGSITMSEEEFSAGFTGIFFEFTPSETFQADGKSLSVIEHLKPRLKKNKEAMIYIVLMSLMLIIPGILIPGFSKIFIDDILIKKTEDGLIILLLAMLVTSGVRALCTWLLQKHLIRLEAKLLLQSTAELLWHILRLPMSFFSQRYTGDIMDRISSNQQVAQLLSGGVTSSFVNIISMVFYGLVMLLMNWKLTLIAFLGVFLNASLLYFISIKISSKTFRLYQEIGKLKAMELNGLQIIETLKASSAEGVFFKRWAGLHARTINSQQSLASYALVLQVIPVLLQLLTSTIFFLGLGSYFVIKGQLTLGGLIAMQSLLASFNAPIDGLMSMGLGLQRLKGLFLRMEDVLAYPIEQRFLKPVTQHKNAKISGDLVVEDISFGYSKKDAPIVSGISFHLKQGESMAIVGSTGSGKSTITKCVADLYQPWSGSIRYANKAMKSLSRDELISSIALVDNDSYLFSGTLRENLTLWNADISNSALRQALQVACIEDEIVARGGLDTLVLEKGVNFSGGQRQRIELARALASKPSLLILDEALSALDPITEAKIMKNLAEIELTVLIITHRLTSIRHCNTIVVIKDGHKVQEGHHDQLIEEEGFYQLLCRDI